jgi:hypothetical protein
MLLIKSGFCRFFYYQICGFFNFIGFDYRVWILNDEKSYLRVGGGYGHRGF